MGNHTTVRKSLYNDTKHAHRYGYICRYYQLIQRRKRVQNERFKAHIQKKRGSSEKERRLGLL